MSITTDTLKRRQALEELGWFFDLRIVDNSPVTGDVMYYMHATRMWWIDPNRVSLSAFPAEQCQVIKTRTHCGERSDGCPDVPKHISVLYGVCDEAEEWEAKHKAKG